MVWDAGQPLWKRAYEIELFCFIAQGGADGLTGHYLGRQLDGFDTADIIIERVQQLRSSSGRDIARHESSQSD